MANKLFRSVVPLLLIAPLVIPGVRTLDTAGAPSPIVVDPWPNASTTGPRSTPSTPITGDFTTTSDGQVVSGIAVTNGTIIIAHQNVTLEDFTVSTTGTYGILVQPGATGLDAKYGEISGPQTGIQGFGTFGHMDISNVENGLVCANGSTVILEDSFLHDFFAAVDPHYDGVAAQGSSSNIIIRRNRISGTPGAEIQGIFITTENGATDSVSVEENLIENCTFNITFGVGVTNASATNNTLKRGTNGYYNLGAGVTPTLSGNVSTRGYYIDGDAAPVVGDVAFSPSAGQAGNDANVNTAFRVLCTLASNANTQFRVVFQSGVAGTDLRGMAIGKRSSGNASALPLQELEFGGVTLAASPIDMTSRTQLVSDWFTPVESFEVGDVMLVGFAMENPGGTGHSAGNSNASSYFSGTVAAYDDAAPAGWTAAANADFGILRIEAQ